jgi:hypothetical protein
VVVSPHKFVGGPQTPGVLVVRREMVGNQVPSTLGGGTIAIPAGLVVSLREAVGTPVIPEREQGWWQHALDAWRRPRESAGHRLLEDYRFDATSGVGRHRELPEPAPPSFADLLGAEHPAPVTIGDEALPVYLGQACELLGARPDTCPSARAACHRKVLRDFHLPPVCLT